MKSKKHRKSVGVGPEGLRAQLVQGLVANPNDQEIIAGLRELDHQETVRVGIWQTVAPRQPLRWARAYKC